MPPPSQPIRRPRASMRARQNCIATWWPYFSKDDTNPVWQLWYDKRTQNQSTKRLKKQYLNRHGAWRCREAWAALLDDEWPPHWCRWEPSWPSGLWSLPPHWCCGATFSAMMLIAFFKHVIHTLVLGGWFDFISKAHVSILNGREAPNHIWQTWLNCARTLGCQKWTKRVRLHHA